MASLPNAVPLHSGPDVDSDWRAALMDVGIPYDIVTDVDARGGAGLGSTTRGGDGGSVGGDDALCERLLARKAAAVAREDFAEAKRLKRAAARVREVGDQVARLQECKRFAVLREACCDAL